MLRKSTREERFGCLFGILGMLTGLIAAPFFLASEVKEGIFIIATSLTGAFLGLFLGALTGMIISRLMPPSD